jgi:hypothetical protein
MEFSEPRRTGGRHVLLAALLTAGSLAALTACSGPAVNYDYDAKANYSAYRTFDWLAEPAAHGGGFDNPIMNERVRRAVETQLTAKGYRLETGANPDFLVSYYPRREPNRSNPVRLGLGFGMGPLGVGVSGPAGDGHREAIGAIILEVQDFRTRTLVWKATAEGALQGSDNPEEADADVNAAIRNMLKRFPPGR